MDNNIDNKMIGERIRQGREQLELTREKFAEIVELSPVYIGQLERGERQMSLPTLFTISECLHVSLDYLIKGSNKDKLDCLIRDKEINKYLEKNNDDFHQDDMKEIISLISRCSKKEVSVIKDVIKVILPHLKR